MKINSPLYGGNGGNPFEQRAKEGEKIVGFVVGANSGFFSTVIDWIQPFFSDGKSGYKGKGHGENKHQNDEIFLLEKDDTFKQINVKYDKYINGIQFVTTNNKVSKWFGGSGSNLGSFDIIGDLVGIKGRAGSYIDSIQFLCEEKEKVVVKEEKKDVASIYPTFTSSFNLGKKESFTNQYPNPNQGTFEKKDSFFGTKSPIVEKKEIKNERVKLFENNKERERFETLADLYSIIKTVEHLERAYVRDSVEAEPYSKACTKLIAQFKTLNNIVGEYVPSVEDFMKTYQLRCPAAENRLLKIGVDAVVEHGSTSNKGQKLIAETAQHFITAMNALQLQQKSVDQLQPWLASLSYSLNECPIKDYEGKSKIKEWLILLNSMKATDELNDEQVRQLSFDLESAYNGFHKLL